MHRMILDLMDVARLEEGRLVLQPEAVEATELARAAAAEAEASAGPREVAIEVVPPSRDCILQADPSIVRRILDNLMANAVAHSTRGSTVRLAVCCREEGIELSVADAGPGIPEEHRERIFEKYARLELRDAGITANRGLGLTFCKLATEAHGGTIWVEDAPGGGAVFRVLLPAHEDSAPAGIAREHAASSGTEPVRLT
jgi:signal transduction histidine kinase